MQGDRGERRAFMNATTLDVALEQAREMVGRAAAVPASELQG